MNIFEKPKIHPHRELDKQWKRLTKRYKQEALGAAHKLMRRDKELDELHRRKKEAEKGKRVGKECTCLPEKKKTPYIDDKCRYCQDRHWDDYYNSPG